MFLNTKYKNIFLVFSSVILYFLFAYFLERTAFYEVLTLWTLLFLCFYLLVKNNEVSFSNLVGFSILFRLIFLFATPNLSQDFYRFIWDGRMIFEGLNPYLSLPETFIEQNNYPIHEAKELYLGMGELNGSHYTNYPPLNQLNFLIAALFSSKSIFGSIILLRLQIIFADIGIIYFGKKLLSKLNLNPKSILWYALNPFIIIEMTGNLHFEPVMLFFLIVALYKLHQQKWITAAVLLACSIAVKLIPFLFLPLFLKWFINKKVYFNLKNTKKAVLFYIIILGTCTLLFLPFYSTSLVDNYLNSVGLWFKNFEFNASLYYIFREIGYLFRGYNEIAILGKIAPIVTIFAVIFLSLFRKNENLETLITSILIIICCYYFFSTTVHPWYISTPLLLSIFTKYKFPILWTFLVILSYQAYANSPWQENLYFVALEYIVLFGFLTYEVKYKQTKKIFNS